MMGDDRSICVGSATPFYNHAREQLIGREPSNNIKDFTIFYFLSQLV